MVGETEKVMALLLYKSNVFYYYNQLYLQDNYQYHS